MAKASVPRWRYKRYKKYKTATDSVTKWLKQQTAGTDELSWSTRQIWLASRQVVTASVPVPADIMRKLSLSIRLRWETSKAFPKDSGHEYFLNMLRMIKHEWVPLALAAPRQPKASRRRVRFSNASAALSPDDDEPLPPFDAEKFVPEAPDDIVAIRRQELRDAIIADQLIAFCFLMELDEAMGYVRMVWQMFKDGATGLVSVAALTNAQVRHVEALTSQLQTNLPYLIDFWHVTTLIACGPLVLRLMDEHEVSIGTAVEVMTLCKWTSSVDPPKVIIEQKLQNREAVAKVLSWGQVLYSEVNPQSSTVKPVDRDADVVNQTRWLGGDDNLFHMHVRLSRILQCVQPNMVLRGPSGHFSAVWDENVALAASSLDLRDELFTKILPPMLMHTQGTHVRLERQSDWMPWERLVDDFQRTRHVSIPLVFACQSLLHAMLATQGPDVDAFNCKSVAVAARNAVQRLRRQLLTCIANKSGVYMLPLAADSVASSLSWANHLYKTTTKCAYFSVTELDRAWFNPWMAGQVLLAIQMDVCLSRGLAVMDDVGQGRLVLHLYNALRCLHLIAPIPEMDILVNMPSPSLWPGGRPTQPGGFTKCHLLAMGHDPATVAIMTASINFNGPKPEPPQHKQADASSTEYRLIRATAAADVSESYRLLSEPVVADFDAMGNLLSVVNNDCVGLLRLNLNMVGSLFRDIWRDMNRVFGWWRHGPFPANDTVQNQLWGLQLLLCKCDKDPSANELYVAANVVAQVMTRLPEAILYEPMVIDAAELFQRLGISEEH